MSKSLFDGQLLCLLHRAEFESFWMVEESRGEEKKEDVTDWGDGGVN